MWNAGGSEILGVIWVFVASTRACLVGRFVVAGAFGLFRNSVRPLGFNLEIVHIGSRYFSPFLLMGGEASRQSKF